MCLHIILPVSVPFLFNFISIFKSRLVNLLQFEVNSIKINAVKNIQPRATRLVPEVWCVPHKEYLGTL